MANTTLTQAFTNIANAIRAKGVTGTMSPLEMPAKIASIPTGNALTNALTIDGITGQIDSTFTYVDFSNAARIPSLGSTHLLLDALTAYKFIVPDSLYNSWVADTNWSALASHITSTSEYAAIMTNYGGQDSMDN